MERNPRETQKSFYNTLSPAIEGYWACLAVLIFVWIGYSLRDYVPYPIMSYELTWEFGLISFVTGLMLYSLTSLLSNNLKEELRLFGFVSLFVVGFTLAEPWFKPEVTVYTAAQLIAYLGIYATGVFAALGFSRFVGKIPAGILAGVIYGVLAGMSINGMAEVHPIMLLFFIIVQVFCVNLAWARIKWLRNEKSRLEREARAEKFLKELDSK